MPPPSVMKIIPERCHPKVRRAVGSGIEFDLEWDTGWGEAFGAALVPLVPSVFDADQLELRVGASGVRQPLGSQVQMEFREFARGPTPPPASTPPLAWPAGAPRAMLFVLFQSSNPHYPSNNVAARLKSAFRSFFGLESATVSSGPVPTPSKSEIREAIAGNLREFAIDARSKGVLQP